MGQGDKDQGQTNCTVCPAPMAKGRGTADPAPAVTAGRNRLRRRLMREKRAALCTKLGADEMAQDTCEREALLPPPQSDLKEGTGRTAKAQCRPRARNRPAGRGRRQKLRERRALFASQSVLEHMVQHHKQHQHRKQHRKQLLHRKHHKKQDRKQHKQHCEQQHRAARQVRRRTRWALLWLGLLLSSHPDSKGVELSWDSKLQMLTHRGNKEQATAGSPQHKRTKRSKMGKRGQTREKIMVGTSEQEPD